MKQFLVEEQVLQALYEYLMKKPMLEVEPLVNSIRQLKPIEEEIDNG
jgi:hypothetical protein